MAIFRGVGGSGDSSDNSFLQEVTGQANAASASASAASASASAASASATSALNTELTSASFNTSDGVLTLTKQDGETVTADLDGRFLTSYTETNNLSSAVTWANVPNANITAGSVTQHQAALSITESQISNLGSYLTASDITGKANLSGATFTGDITAKSKLIVNKQPVASDLLTTSRSIQDLAAWSVYGGTGSNYALTPEKYRDSLDVNQDNQFSGTDSYGILLFVSNNYTPNELSTFQSLINNPSNITSTFVQDVLDGDYDSLSTSAGVAVDRDASSIVTVSGDIAVSGTVDGRDVLADGTKLDGIEASADVTDATSVASAGAAMLTGADFTGDVRIADDTELKFGDSTNGDLRIFHTSSNNTSTIREQGSSAFLIQGQDLYLSDTSGDNYLYGQSGADVRLYFNGSPKLNTRDTGVNFTGDITLTGTVDGRDVATDGTKLDGIEASATADQTDAEIKTAYENNSDTNAFTDADHTKLDGITSEASASHNYTTQLYQGYLNLTTSVNQVGPDFYLRNYSDNHYKRFVEVAGSVSYVGLTSTNDLNLRTILVVPSSSGSAVDIGSVDSITTTGTYNRDIVIVGDVSHWFSEYSGTALNSNGTSAFSSIVSAIYNPTTNKTTINAGVFGITPPSVGDSIYVHPFDWESAGTEIYGVIKQLDADNESTMSYEIYNKVYFGNIDRVATCRIKLYEAASSDSVVVQRLRVYQLDERA